MNLGFESENIEFKESLAEKDEALKDICAILNKKRMGTLYFGVKNNGDIVGVEVGAKTESDFAMRLSQTIQPAPFYSIALNKDNEGRCFLEINFEGKNVPYRYKGAYYLRNGERSEVMPSSVLERYILEKQKDYSLWENSPSEATISDLDEDLIASVRKTANESNKLKILSDTPEGILKELRLLTKNGEVNKAGEALFSKYRPYAVKFGIVADDKGLDYLQMEKAYGNIFQLIDESFAFVLNAISFQPLKSATAIQREMIPEIPRPALREIIVNMFAHSDYSSPMEHRITVYQNRIEFYNPGLFPANATPEEFANKEIDPVDKNGKILKVLFGANYIEHFGTGFTKVFQIFDKEKITYGYRENQNGFCFIIYRKNRYYIDESLSEYSKVMSVMQQDNYVTVEKIAELLGKSKSTISRYVKTLQEDGKISRGDSKKFPRWEIKK